MYRPRILVIRVVVKRTRRRTWEEKLLYCIFMNILNLNHVIILFHSFIIIKNKINGQKFGIILNNLSFFCLKIPWIEEPMSQSISGKEPP